MNKPFSRLLLVFFIVITNSINSQELPEVLPPSPTVANLMQFEEVPISYYTGQPNISIPIYSKAISGGLSLNIGLSYNTQGVKLNSRSGWTGTGWSLNAGGTISRTVRGEPDEISTATHPVKVGIYHLNDYWNYDNPSTDKARFNYHVAGTSTKKYDNKPDLYQFNFMGYSGRFVILKNGNTLVPKFITNNSNIKVEFVKTNDYAITSFKLTDAKGFVYSFDAVENSDTYPFTGTQSQGHGNTYNISASQAQQGYFANTAWHLTKIENSSNKQLVSLNYSNVLEQYTAAISSSENVIRGMDPSSQQMMTNNSYNQGILEPYHSISYQNVSTVTKKLSTITFLQDNTKVNFNLDTNYTHPETLGKVLKSIQVKRNTDIDKTLTFNYEETTDNSTSVVKKRVWLTKLTETRESINQDYKFNYYQKENLPGFNDGYQNSAWGYHSGINNNLLSCTSNNIYDDNMIKTGLLTAIEYPTGGVKEFEFEHNTYSFFQNQQIGANDYNKNPRNRIQESQFTDNLNYSNGVSPLNLLIDTFTLDFEQDIFISSSVTASQNQYLDKHRIKISKTNTSSYDMFIELNQQCSKVTNLPAGNYTMTLVPYEDLLLSSYQINGDYRVSYTSSKNNPKQEMIGGGVRIKEVRFKDHSNALDYSKKLIYSYQKENNSALSSGVIDSKADKLERKYIKTTSRHLFGNEINVCTSFDIKNVQYQVTENSYNVELSQGSYVGYEHVKVLEQGNGYKTYSYTSPALYPSALGTFNYETPKPKENLDYKRGLLLEEKVFNQSGKILKETSYKDTNGNPNYEFSEVLLFKDRNVFKPNCGYLQFYDSYTFYLSGTTENHVPSATGGNCSYPSYSQTPCGVFTPISTNFNSGWAKLKGNTTKDYFYNGNTQSVKETRQEFTYNNVNYQIATQDTYYDVKGNDEHLQTKYYYPVGTSLNSNSSAIKSKLVSSNKITEVLETQSYRNGSKTSETHNIYHDFDASSKNLMLPKEVKVGKGSVAPEKRIEFLRYDAYGNPTQVKKTAGTTIIYVYGFNGSVPVAKITNGNYSAVANLNPTGNLTTAQENSLRNALPNAMLSFYRYDPLKGVTSMVDDKGYTTYYEYDAFNRLKRVKDAQGHILSENTYNYKNQ